MRIAVSRIAKSVIRLVVPALTIAFVGAGAASASELTFNQRVEAGMSQGLDYTAAVSAASRGADPGASVELVVWAQAAESELNAGKDYQDAWQMTKPSYGYSATKIARAKLIQEELNRGVDYVTAWEAGEYPAQQVASEATTTAR